MIKIMYNKYYSVIIPDTTLLKNHIIIRTTNIYPYMCIYPVRLGLV